MNKITSILLMISIVISASCSRDERPLDSKDVTKEIVVNVAPLANCSDTKTSVSGTGFNWSTSDKLSVWPLTVAPGQSAQQLEFTLKERTDAHNAVFEGTGWALICDNNHKYYAYYPYNATDTQTCATITYPIYFSVQIKWTTGLPEAVNTVQVGQYMYMYAPQVKPANPESASFSFYHLSSLAIINVTFPESAIGKTASFITISTDDNVFTLEAQYDPSIITSSSSPVVTRTQTTNSLKAGISNGVTIGSGAVSFPLPMFPAALQGKELHIQAYTKSGEKYDATYLCTKNQEPGTLYTYAVTATEHTIDSPMVPVDMGTSVYWATVNIGAEVPEEVGYKLNWGSLQSDLNGDWSVYKWGNYRRIGVDPNGKANPDYAPDYGLTKYNNSDGKTVLEAADDAVAQLWGNGWRMPTKSEIDELRSHCERSEMTQLNGINGFYYYNPDDLSKSIFLPASMYWSSTLVTSYTARYSAWSYLYDRENPVHYPGYARSYLMAIRPVKDK